MDRFHQSGKTVTGMWTFGRLAAALDGGGSAWALEAGRTDRSRGFPAHGQHIERG